MFALSPVSISTRHRASPSHFFSEIVATLGLVLVVFALTRTGRARLAPAAVGAYIGAAYFFTSSTSFANPAITVGRTFSNTFAGIAPNSLPSFVLAQLAGGALAVLVVKVLYPEPIIAEAAAGPPVPRLEDGSLRGSGAFDDAWRAARRAVPEPTAGTADENGKTPRSLPRQPPRSS